MTDAELEKAMLTQILQQLDRGRRAPGKVNWWSTASLALAAGIAAYLLTTSSVPWVRAVLPLVNIIIGGAFIHALLKAWHDKLWSYATRYIDANAIRARLADLK